MEKVKLGEKLAIFTDHYRKETLFSQEAREEFLKPDLTEFPKTIFLNGS